jgi:hypothetical protein
MFESLLKRVDDKCVVLENFLRVYEALDDVALNPTSPIYTELSSKGIVQTNLTEDRVFRHCAIIIQLYGLYEWFAESMLSFWLLRLPRYQRLTDLPESFKNAYRYGIARIVQNIDHGRYRHLSLPDVLQKYLKSMQGASRWELVNDALIFHDANLRMKEFTAMFACVELDGVWHEIERSAQIADFKGANDLDESLESLVLDLVTFRNEAAHGTPDEILGSNALRTWISFIEAFCIALGNVIIRHVVASEVSHRPNSVLGVVTETFTNNILVAICDRGSIKVGDTIYFLRDTDCVQATIESLQLNDIDQSQITIHQAGLEVGMRTSKRVHKKAQLVSMFDPSTVAQDPVPAPENPDVPSHIEEIVLRLLSRLRPFFKKIEGYHRIL